MGQSSIDNLLLRPGGLSRPRSPETVILLTSEADEPTLADSEVTRDGEPHNMEYHEFEDIMHSSSILDSLNEVNTPQDFSDSDRGTLTAHTRVNTLMSVLNGNQQITKTGVDELSSGLSSISESDLTDDLRALEKRVYKSGKIVTLNEVLGRSKAKVATAEQDIYKLEAQLSVSAAQRGVSVKDFLGQKAKPKTKYLVTMKVDKEALAFFKKFENPLKARGNTTFSRVKGRFSDLVHPVTLRIRSEKLKEITANVDFSKPKPQNSVFDFMMRSSALNTVKLTPLQMLKELMPPRIQSNELHVKEESFSHQEVRFLRMLPKRHQKMAVEEPVEPFHYISADPTTFDRHINITDTTISDESYLIAFEERCGLNLPLFRYIYSLESLPDLRQELWAARFQPNSIATLLIADANKDKLRNWLHNSFARLKNQSFKGSRDAKKKQQKRNKNLYNDLDNFIVPDAVESDTEEEIFTPILIITGKTGSGKSSSIYAAMNELDGYIHELNGSQVRSRREIASALKELCTTHALHGKSEEGEFKKGVVLLEDCDILFEQDRTFWTAVQEVLDISRRPIIITCTDIGVVPKQIFNLAQEEAAIIDLGDGCVRDAETMKTFLWGCCFSMHFRLSEEVLEHLVEENGSDIRKSLLSCQAICLASQKNASTDGTKRIFDVAYTSGQPDENLQQGSIETLSNSLDMLSVGDVIETNSFTQIRHENIANEFIDINFLDESHRLKQPLMPHERSISSFFEEPKSRIESKPLPTNNIRASINAFIASRSRPLSGHLQEFYDIRDTMRATRSFVDSDIKPWTPEPTGIPEGSLCDYLGPTPFILDLAPFCRYWNELQKVLDQGDPSIKNRIRWRDFQDSSNSIAW